MFPMVDYMRIHVKINPATNMLQHIVIEVHLHYELHPKGQSHILFPMNDDYTGAHVKAKTRMFLS